MENEIPKRRCGQTSHPNGYCDGTHTTLTQGEKK